MDAWVDRPRLSVQVAVIVAVPGDAPAVLKVAVVPFPVTVPPLAVQLETETGTPSGLVQVQVKVAEPPTVTEDGSAVQLMVGGFFGGSGLIV